MAEATILSLEAWDSFYTILGGSAGALIGLQFVVLTLVAERPVRGAAGATAAFATPTIVHFAVALLLALLMRTPWPTLTCLLVGWSVVGLAGLGYTGIIVRRIRIQVAYRPVAEDWWFHVLLPAGAYVVLLVAAGLAPRHPGLAPFLVAGSALLLLYVSIHNAWDAVSYHVLTHDAADAAPRHALCRGPRRAGAAASGGEAAAALTAAGGPSCRAPCQAAAAAATGPATRSPRRARLMEPAQPAVPHQHQGNMILYFPTTLPLASRSMAQATMLTGVAGARYRRRCETVAGARLGP